MRKLTIPQQGELIERCISESKDLGSELRRNGYSYDSLVYENNELEPSEFLFDSAGLIDLKSIQQRHKYRVPVVSFFSGCGGLDVGLELAGFETIAMTEIHSVFCDTLRSNFKGQVIGPPSYTGDVRNLDEIVDALKRIGVTENFEGVFVGGPPCQSFSIAANQRFSKSGRNFKRTGFQHEEYGNLLFDFISLISVFRPKAFLIENVEGILSIDGGSQVVEACQTLGDFGYNVSEPKILNAADYLVPQNRFRAFIVGGLDFSFCFPQPHSHRVPCGKVLSGNIRDLPNSETREHKAESILRYMKLPYGKRDKLGRVDRLNPLLPSKTVIAGGTNGGGRSHLHPFIPRTMSVRECARLQTFPDSFVFTGPSARQFTQVGNAVPPLLAYALGISLSEGFRKNKSNKAVQATALRAAPDR